MLNIFINSNMGWFDRLKKGLSKTSSSLNSGINFIFNDRKLTADTLEQLEELLIMSDIGVATSTEIIEELAKEKFNKAITDDEVKQYLCNKFIKILHPLSKPIAIQNSPHVILLCGVNGNGKTTTAGKLAAQYTANNKKVLLAACDTFRAAAIEQLEEWANRCNCPIIKGSIGSDPASVAYKAMEKAYNDNYDIILIDTAGRLHNKKNLMDELAKITRVIKKIDNNAPHSCIMVLDATTGQNAIIQATTFSKIIGINGLIVTKLDGTAKAGIIISIAKKLQLPLHAIGVGEKIEDLSSFNAQEFVNNLIKT